MPNINNSEISNVQNSHITKPRRSFWQWCRDNDIVILIVVVLIGIACTRMAAHVDEQYLHPAVQRVLNGEGRINNAESYTDKDNDTSATDLLAQNEPHRHRHKPMQNVVQSVMPHFRNYRGAPYSQQNRQQQQHSSSQTIPKRINNSSKWSILMPFIEFLLVLLLLYVLVEFILRPQAPIHHYLLPDSVVSYRKPQKASYQTDATNQSVQSAWTKSFLPPPNPNKTIKRNDWWWD